MAVYTAEVKGAWIHGGQVVPSDLHINTENFLALAAGGQTGVKWSH